MNAPFPPRCTLARFIPTQVDTEEIKADGWNTHKILVVRLDDPRIGWIEKQVLQQVGDKLYGRRARG